MMAKYVATNNGQKAYMCLLPSGYAQFKTMEFRKGTWRMPEHLYERPRAELERDLEYTRDAFGYQGIEIEGNT